MSHDLQNPLHHPEVQLASTPRYVVGFVISAALMVASFLVVRHGAMPALDAQVLIAAIALVAVLVQSYLLFHLNFSETQRWHTAAFVLTIPLFVLLVGLSMWMFHALAARTMIPGMH
ncbi:MAG: cytochrome O ubiquinol oxidase [Gammaproteobacteria bacterium]